MARDFNVRHLSSNNTHKRAKAIQKEQDHLNTVWIKNQCDCTHTTQNYGLDVRLNKEKRKSGQLVCTCRKCLKDLYLNHIPEQMLVDAINVVDRAFDSIKINLKLDNRKEKRILGWVSEFQYRLEKQVKPLYDSTRSDKDKKNKSSKNAIDLDMYVQPAGTRRNKGYTD